jgi:YrbI family 3-deoxy-D-manno-octulosonate 8-phosphate phosphatase
LNKPIVAIIPARGGSKGILRKNVKILAGKPLVAWSIESALAVPLIDTVVVSTDDVEIAAVARQFGADVVMRPGSLATDAASSESALLHVLAELKEQRGYEPEVVVFLQCTSPLTTAEDISGTLNLVLEKGFDSAVTMTPFHYFVWEEDETGQMVGVNHVATRRLMRQQRKPQYLEVGAVYAMRAEGLIKNQFRFFGNIGHYPIPTSRSLEIDTPDDWLLAENIIYSRQDRQTLPLDRLKQVKAVVTDFDGVMTDNRVYLNEDGVESVVCNRGDGWGIGLMKELGLLVACISTETNPVVAARCRKLQIAYWQGQSNKLAALKAFLEENKLQAKDCLYIGNDTNDSACLQYAGLAVVPRDASVEVVSLAHWQTISSGGSGVLREVARGLKQAKQL